MQRCKDVLVLTKASSSFTLVDTYVNKVLFTPCHIFVIFHVTGISTSRHVAVCCRDERARTHTRSVVAQLF